MSFTERAREHVYWLLDSLKGRPVGKYLDEIKDAHDHGAQPEKVEAQMQKLFQHAAQTTAFYAGLRGRDKLSLSDFPVMNKQLYREHYDECLSSVYKNAKDNRIMSTSGSTGTPFRIVQNRDKVDRCTACSMLVCSLSGYTLGDKQAYVRVWANDVRISFLQQQMENRLSWDATRMDINRLRQFQTMLAQKKISSIMGYASYLAAFSDYLENEGGDAAQGAKYAVKSIIAISEHLPDSARAQLGKYFGITVNSSYCNSENGMMACQEGGDEYYVDSSSLHYEILKPDSDEPAQDGELGRIVITDLYNFALPLIRYDTGDMAIGRHVRDDQTGRYWFYLTEVYGRRSDMVCDKDGKPISPRSITVLMRDFSMQNKGIVQFQFIQRAEHSYRFKLVCDGSIDQDKLLSLFSPLFGDDITIEIVDELPVLASGKRKTIVNEMEIARGKQ